MGDPLVPIAFVKELDAMLPDSTLRVYQAGHFLPKAQWAQIIRDLTHHWGVTYHTPFVWPPVVAPNVESGNTRSDERGRWWAIRAAVVIVLAAVGVRCIS